jgi:hypothetical protein
MIPEGCKLGKPDKEDIGSYYINGKAKPYFWDGDYWYMAKKDFAGEYNWHYDVVRKPIVKSYKLIKHVYIQRVQK